MAIADLHWGVMDSNIQTSQYQYILKFLEIYPKQIDLIVLCGDYFDTRIMLGSASAIASINWLEKLLEIAKKKNVSRVRIIRGTKEHDNDQLEALRRLEKDEFFKIFITNTVEETLPNLKVIYCPEENIKHDEYIEKYADNILCYPDIGFFHGNFDNVIPSVAIKQMGDNTLVYEYAFWDNFISGPMIAGHWHDGVVDRKLHYIGTPDRWEFGEDEPKGFAMMKFNTEDHSYFYKKILNPNCPVYLSYIVLTDVYDSIEQFQSLFQDIDQKIKELKKDGKKVKVRIIIQITDDKPSNLDFISHLRTHYLNSKRVKITVKNKLQKKRKKEEQKRQDELNKKYGFTSDTSLSQAEIIRRYIIEKKGRERPLDKIEAILSKYS